MLDNATSHPDPKLLIADDGHIVVMYMPPNVTSLIQPMDQSIIYVTKAHYKTALACKIQNDMRPVSEILKSITLKHAIIFLANAWGSNNSRNY